MNMTQTAVQAAHPPAEGISMTLRRAIGGAVALGSTTLLGLAAWLEPARDGLGTHSQLFNLPPCGWILGMDLPCPTCGMTTAFATAADGHLVGAFVVQPMGAALAVGTAMALIVGAWTAATGSRVAWLFGRLGTRRTAWFVGGAFVAAWGYKIIAYKELLG